MRLLMVCLGNICRSPIAEGVMCQKIREHHLDWTVASAGTESYHVGEPPHRLSQKVCSAHGIDISGQRASRLSRSDFAEYDKIYAFAGDVYREVLHIGGDDADRGRVDYFLNELTPAANLDVPDPDYGGEEGYHHVYELVEKTCDKIIENYKQAKYV